MRRLLVVLAVVAVLIAGVVAAIEIHRLQSEPDIRGSSTEEFTLPTTTAPRPTATPQIQWPQYGLDGEHPRAVSFALRPPYRRVWWYGAGSLVEFPPAIGFGRLYFSTNSGKFVAVNMETGKRAWKYLTNRCVAASPALGPYKHATVYAVSKNTPPCNTKKVRDGKIVAFSAGVGKIRWQKTIGPSETSPLIDGDRLYVGDWKGWVYALDARNGKTIWKFRTRGAVKGSAAVSGRRLYVGSYDGHLYCFAAKRGRLIWKNHGQKRLFGSSRFYSTPALAYGRLYIGSTDGKVYSFGATTGALRWPHSTGGYVYASPAVANDSVFVGSYSGRFFAFDAATGAERWHFQANGKISGSATVIGDVVYFATLKKRTYALSTRTGKVLWTFPDGKYTPFVAVQGRLFLIGY